MQPPFSWFFDDDDDDDELWPLIDLRGFAAGKKGLFVFICRVLALTLEPAAAHLKLQRI